MATTVTQASHTQVKAGKATLLAVSVTSAPAVGTFTVHDCVDPGQASIMNCMWPPNNMHDPNVAQFGLVIHVAGGSPAAAGTGQLKVTYA